MSCTFFFAASDVADGAKVLPRENVPQVLFFLLGLPFVAKDPII
jgi:hypothetical protein